MHKKLLSLLLLMLLSCSVAWAQQGQVQGTVTDANTGESIPGVNVTIVETQQGAATDAQGEYTISGVESGSYTLRATFVGYQTREQSITVNAGETTTVDLQLKPGAVQLEEVAVTALGFEESRDQQGAASAQVSGDAVVQSGESTVSKALSAKAAGLNITSSGGDPGAAARITIRGNTTIQGNNQPLIVVDGVPISNSTFGSGVAGVQQQSRLNDLNPNNIASVEVLKGASAAALWGSKAQSGVIVIETKKGDYGSDMNVSFKTSYGFNELNLTQNLQEQYGQGTGGVYDFGESSSWGDRISDRQGGADVVADESSDPNWNGVAVGQQTGNKYYAIPSAGAPNAQGGTYDAEHGGKRSTETYNHAKDIFQSGYEFESNLSVSGGGENGRYYVSIGHTNNAGIIPVNSDFERTSIRVNADRQFTDDFSVNTSANFVRNASNRAQQGSNLSGILLGSYRTAAGFNNKSDYLVNYYPNGLDGPAQERRQRSYRNPIGSSANAGYDNPVFVYNEIENTTLVNRLTGKVEANYSLTDWIELTARTGLDTYTDRRRSFFPINNSTAQNGQASESQITEYRVNADFLARANRELTDYLNLGATVGFQFTHQETDNLGGSISDFSNPRKNYRSLSNTTAQNSSAFTGQSTQRTVGTFTKLDFDFYDQLFVELTGRIDQSSTFGEKASDTFFYPSANVAWQFHKVLGDVPLLSFGKLRASYGVVGREPSPYNSKTYFTPASTFDGFIGGALSASGYGGGFEKNNALGNPQISPERTKSFEVGTTLRFFEDRLSVKGSYYNTTSEDVIFFVDTPPSSGYNNRLSNAATISDEGYELDVEMQWPSVGGFQWTTSARWWTNENIVTDLAGVEEVGLAGFVSTTSSLVEGQPYGVLYGNAWRRAEGWSYEDQDGDGTLEVASEGCDPAKNSATNICEPLNAQERSAGFTVGKNGRVLSPDGYPTTAGRQGVIGNPQPDYRASIGNTLRFKGLSLYTLFDFKVGGDVWNGTKGALYFFGRHGDQTWSNTIDVSNFKETPKNFLGQTPSQLVSSGAWPEYRDAAAGSKGDGKYKFRGYVKDFGAGPVLIDEYYFSDGPGSGFTGPSEQFIEDGSYVKLREVSLSYNWDAGLIQQAGLSSVKFTATATNVLTFTDYSGIDPETNLTGPSNGQGLDYFNNPNMRSYRFGIQVNY